MKKEIDDYHVHEALDRTFMVMEMFSYVSEHPAVKANDEWAKKSEEAHHAMFELYQMIGAEHLNPSQPQNRVKDREMSEWEEWFAWKPVTLLTAEIAWLKFVSRRKTTGIVPGNPSWAGDETWQYADAYFSKPQKHIR